MKRRRYDRGHAETYGNHPLRVDWLEDHPNLGLTICPGRKDRKRNLDADMAVLPDGTTLICLIPEIELKPLGLTRRKLTAAAKRAGHTIEFFPIRDFDTPADWDTAATFIEHVADDLVWPGEDPVVVFCKGGLGRSGMVVAAVLCALGEFPDDAIDAVREARSPQAVETLAQERFVGWYAALPVGVVTRTDFGDGCRC